MVNSSQLEELAPILQIFDDGVGMLFSENVVEQQSPPPGMEPSPADLDTTPIPPLGSDGELGASDGESPQRKSASGGNANSPDGTPTDGKKSRNLKKKLLKPLHMLDKMGEKSDGGVPRVKKSRFRRREKRLAG